MNTNRITFSVWFSIMSLVCVINSCKPYQPPPVDGDKPKRPQQEYFDKKYFLDTLPHDAYKEGYLHNSFAADFNNGSVSFQPLSYPTKLNLQYTHIYSSKCVYRKNENVWKFAEVCFPNTCLTNDKAYASATIRNATSTTKTFYVRLFYQNTSYWYPTDSSIDFKTKNYLENYYGASEIMEVKVPANDSAVVKVPYTVGMNPKHEFDHTPWNDPARPGNYEFMLLVKENKDPLLLSDSLNLKTTNPFAVIKQDQLQHGGKQYYNDICYTGAHHFKFVFLEEFFDGTNDLTPGHIYIPKDSGAKKLCDTCTGWYHRVIKENYNLSEFFEGFIAKAGYVKADYGYKKENVLIDSNGIRLKIPKSRRGDYKKTWGEFLFAPSYKYGHLIVRAKFSRMMNKFGTSNGIIHNLWLYQRDYEKPDTTNPFHYLTNGNGTQPYEIDFEFWSTSSFDTLTLWDDQSFINYSIVDYMRDPNVQLRPGELKKMGKYQVERLNQRQMGIQGEEFDRFYFDNFHTYEMYWYPDKVSFWVDGFEKAVITKDMAKIPDRYMFLWIGSPLYQDGTYFKQSDIPFLKYDKYSIIDYIKIE